MQFQLCLITKGSHHSNTHVHGEHTHQTENAIHIEGMS